MPNSPFSAALLCSYLAVLVHVGNWDAGVVEDSHAARKRTQLLEDPLHQVTYSDVKLAICKNFYN